MSKEEKTEQELWQIRCAQAEKTIEECSAAFELVPVWALEKGQTWIPSEVAILLLRKAKESVKTYSLDHWHTGSDT